MTAYRSDLYKHQQEVQQFSAEVQEKAASYKWFIENYMALMSQYSNQTVGGTPRSPEQEPQKGRKE